MDLPPPPPIPFPDERAAEAYLWDHHYEADGNVIPGHSMWLRNHEPWRSALLAYIPSLRPIPDFRDMVAHAKRDAAREGGISETDAELLVAEVNLAYFAPEWEEFLTKR